MLNCIHYELLIRFSVDLHSGSGNLQSQILIQSRNRFEMPHLVSLI